MSGTALLDQTVPTSVEGTHPGSTPVEPTPTTRRSHRVIGKVVQFLLLAGALSALSKAVGDPGDVIHKISGASWGWVLVAFALACATNATDALATLGAVPVRVPFAPTVELETAASFTGIATPGGLGTMAMKTRFFQQRGVPGLAAVASGALVGLGAGLVQACILGVSFLAARSTFHFTRTGDGTGNGGGLGWVLLGLVAVAVVIGAVLRVPRIRQRIAQPVRRAVDSLRSVLRDPRNLAQILGGNLGSQLLYAFTLWASLRAFGASAPLAVLIVVNTATSLVAGASPTPGGLGVAEATMVATLTAAGVPGTTAVPAVLVHRLVTSWVMPLPGWLAFRDLARRGQI